MRSTAFDIVEGIRMLIADRNTKIADPAFVLGSLVFATAVVESLDPGSDNLLYRIMVIGMIFTLTKCHHLKISGSKADSDSEKLFKVWSLGFGCTNKLL